MGKTKNALFALGGLFEVSTTEPKIPFIEKYDGDHNTWSPVPHDIPFPEGLDFFATVAVEGSLFLIGGFDHVVRRPISSVLALNVDTDSPHYVEAASMSVPRFGHSVVTSQSHVYALGGSSGASMTSVQSMSSVERYDVTQGRSRRDWARISRVQESAVPNWIFHSQEWSVSNFPSNIGRNITAHSMENLAFHSSLSGHIIYC